MASKACNRTQPIKLNNNSSSDNDFTFPSSPGEPGKFDFYRVYVAHHAHYSEPNIAEKLNESTTSTAISSSPAHRRWTPFADILSSNDCKSSTQTSASTSQPVSMPKSQTTSSLDSNTPLNTNTTQKESAQNGYSFFSLTDIVKNAMNRGHLATKSNERQYTCTTLSTKDLNHLSPQSM